MLTWDASMFIALNVDCSKFSAEVDLISVACAFGEAEA